MKVKYCLSQSAKAFLLLVSAVTALQPAIANTTITVSNENSKVGFSGEHAGMQFSGIFEQWTANLTLPPAKAPQITARFQLESAKTGDFTYDSTLPEGDWFDVENYPEGIFISDSITLIDGGYKVSGLLTLKNISNPQTFVLYEQKDGFSADFAIDRIDYNIGLESDPDAEWVSREIMMRMQLAKAN